jgi:hypothetical protein
MERDYDREAKDHPQHRYAYDFDYRMHGFMMRTFEPWFVAGSALELGCFHGNFTRLLCDRFADVEVVEASRECIAEASTPSQARRASITRRSRSSTRRAGSTTSS